MLANGRTYDVRYWDGEARTITARFEDYIGGLFIFSVETGSVEVSASGVDAERQRLFINSHFFYNALEAPIAKAPEPKAPEPTTPNTSVPETPPKGDESVWEAA